MKLTPEQLRKIKMLALHPSYNTFTAQTVNLLIADLEEAQALLKRLSPLMINAGYVGANAEIQRSLRDVRVDRVRLDTPALDAAIAEAIADGRAKRMEALRKWIAATGAISTEGSWYFELESIVAGESK